MSNPQEKTRYELVLEHSQKGIEGLLKSKSEALPKDFNRTRFIQNCMTVLMDLDKDKLEKCQPMSVARTMIKGAFLGLDFFNGECYAIPYGNQLNFQTDYKGEKKLAKKYSINPIKDIYAKLVREGDDFEEAVVEGRQVINFKPLPFNSKEILGAFAVVLYQDGSMDYETMPKSEIEDIKENFSQKSYKTKKFSKAWRITPGEMYKKTVLRRLCKHIELDFDSIEQKKAFDEGSGFEFEKDDQMITETSPFNEAEIIDTPFEEVSPTDEDYSGTPFGDGDNDETN